MPIDFPDNPANGDVFTSGGRRWEFDGSRWSVVSADAAIGTGSIDASKLAADSVTEAKIASSAVTAGKIGAAAVTEAKLGTGAVTADKIGSSAVTESKIASSAVSHSKLASNLSAITVCTAGTKPASPFDGQVIYMTDADQTAAWDGASWVGLERSGGRNVLINGALDIWQRGTSFATSGSYSADRFIVGRSGGGTGCTFTRVSPSDATNLPSFRYAMRCQRDSGNTATNGLTFGQVVETSNSIPLAGKMVTLSFYARVGANFTGGTLSSQLYTGTGIDQNGILGAWTGLANPLSGSHAVTTTWSRYSVSGTLSPSTTELFINFNSNPVGTAGANDWFEITGVQLEAGAVPTPFEFEDIGTTITKCERYYQTIPSAIGSANTAICNTLTGDTARIQLPMFRTVMRSGPHTIVSYLIDGTTAGQTREFSSGTSKTVSSVQNVGAAGGGYAQLTSSVSNPVHWNATYSAEL